MDWNSLAIANIHIVSSTARSNGLPSGGRGVGRRSDTHTHVAALAVRCFGGFNMEVDGTRVEPCVKPRVKKALRYLAMHAGRPVHREILVEALWPEVEPEAGTRNLHVAISCLRLALKKYSHDHGSIIVRNGETYSFTAPSGSHIDVLEFENALTAADAARARGDITLAASMYRRTIDLYRGELLPEDGAAEWVIRERERRRAEATDAALALAEILLEHGDANGAGRACRAGLLIERYCDNLWRALIEAHERAGDLALATRAKHGYQEVLVELGVDAPVNLPSISA